MITNKWQYIPYTIKNSKNKFYTNNKVLSYGCDINIIIGARRIGKTYSTTKYLIKKFLNEGKKFVWFRDNDEARKKLAEDNGAKFFAGVLKNYQYKKFESGSIKGSIISINGEKAGYLLPSSTFQNFKGNDFSDVDIIVYDEFINEINKNKRSGKSWEVINSLFTVASTRPNIKIIMLANALDKADDFLQFLNIDIDKYGIYINRYKNVCLHYADNSAKFEEDRKNSTVGRLIKDTDFESNLFDSTFINSTTCNIFDTLPAKSKILFCLKLDGIYYRLYVKDGIIYVTNDVNGDHYKNKRFCLNVLDLDQDNKILYYDYLTILLDALHNNNIKYKNSFIYKNFITNIKK